MLLQQAVTYLARQSGDSAAMVSESLIFHLPPGTAPQGISVRNPQQRELLFTASADEDGQRLTVTADKPGVYALRGPAGVAEMQIAANLQPRESYLSVLRGRSLESAAQGISARLIDQDRDLRRAVQTSRSGRELWRMLLGLSLVFLIVESFVSRWFARRLSEESAEEQRVPAIGPGRGAKAALTMVGAGR
jgi:hypothetical protein